VTLPALLPVLFSRQFLVGFTTILANAAILALTYVVVGFGLVFIVWWVGVRLFALLGASVTLRRRERLNLALVALISESLQVAFVSGAVWLLYVLLGGLLVSAEVRGAWLLQPTTVIWDVAWFGSVCR
jgi:hypothetical protein